MTEENRTIEVIPSEQKTAPLIVVCTMEGDSHVLMDAIQKHTAKPFSLMTVSIRDWGRELSPWPAPAVMKGTDDFGGEADHLLMKLTEQWIPEGKEKTGIEPEYTARAGYSLAGLFALYSMYRTDCFNRVVSASGSLWYPKFSEFTQIEEMKIMPDALYLSLGDKEAKTKHPLMKTVQEKTEAFYTQMKTKGIPVTLEMNPGNHFTDEPGRLARGIAWIINQ